MAGAEQTWQSESQYPTVNQSMLKLDGIRGGGVPYPGKRSCPGVRNCRVLHKTDLGKADPEQEGVRAWQIRGLYLGLGADEAW